jgi:hypothetical protein
MSRFSEASEPDAIRGPSFLARVIFSGEMMSFFNEPHEVTKKIEDQLETFWPRDSADQLNPIHPDNPMIHLWARQLKI